MKCDWDTQLCYILYNKRGMLPSEYFATVSQADKEILKAFLQYDIDERKRLHNAQS